MSEIITSGSFSDPSQAARLRDLIYEMVDGRVTELASSRMTGVVLDIYQGGPTFNSDVIVESTILPRTQDNPARPWVAKVRLDDTWEGQIIEARIDPNFIPIFRKADFYDEDNPAGSGTMVDRSGRYVTVEVTDEGSAPVDDTYPSLIGTTIQAPQAAPRVAVQGASGAYRVTELIRGVLALETNPGTVMVGPDYASFNTNVLIWGGTIAFARGSEVKYYEIEPEAPIVTYGSDPLSVSSTTPVQIVLGQRSGSMYVNFSSIDGIPVLVWVEAGSDTPIPPEWYLIFARINDGEFSSKLIFASMTDFRSPAAPTNFEVDCVKSGFEKLSLSATWDPVLFGTNGDTIVLSGYEVWGYVNSEDWRRIASTTTNTVSGVTFDSGTAWHFKVRAIASSGVPGIFSDAVSFTFPDEDVTYSTGTSYYQPEEPTDPKEGDEWYDSNDGNTHYVYRDGVWVKVPLGLGGMAEDATEKINNAFSTAMNAQYDATTALDSANGKNKIYIGASQPTGGTYIDGDTWFDTGDGNKIYTYDETAEEWVARVLDSAALSEAVNSSINAAAAAAEAAAEAASGAQATADGKNTVFYSTTAPATTDRKVNDLWFDTDDGNKPYRWSGSAWVAAQFGDAAVSNLDAAKMTTGILDANRIGTNSLNASKVLIGAFDNLIANPGAESGNLSPHVDVNAGVWDITTTARSGSRAFRWTNDASAVEWIEILHLNGLAADMSAHTPCLTDEQFYIETYVYTSVGTVSLGVGIRFHDRTGATVSSYSSGPVSAPLSQWTKITATGTAPAGAAYVRPYVYIVSATASATIAMDDFYMRKLVSGRLIVDGAITADSAIIADGAIGNAQIANAAINNAKIANVDAGKVTTGVLSADRIGANSIVASKVLIGAFDNLIANGGFETGSVAPSVLPAGGVSIVSGTYPRSGTYCIQAIYAAAPTEIFYANGPLTDVNSHIPATLGDQFYAEMYVKATNGTQHTVYIGLKARKVDGTLVSTVTGTAVTPVTNGWIKASVKITITDATVAYVVPYIAYNSGMAGGSFTIDDLLCRKMLTGELIVDGAITADKLSAEAIDGKTITGATVRTGSSGRRLVLGGAALNAYTASEYGSAQFTPDGLRISAETGQYVNITPSFIQKMSNSGTQGTFIDDNGVAGYGLGTTTSGNAATWVTTNTPGSGWYVLRRNTSVRAAKVAYEDIPNGTDILGLRPRRWFDRSEVEEAGLNPDTVTVEECLEAGLRWVPGFIAEEVEQVDPLYCIYENGELTGVAYDRISAALVVALGAVTEELNSTKARLDSIEKRLAALESPEA